MKTKIIQFDLETAKKIQTGEIEGKIVHNGCEVIILGHNSEKYPKGYPIRIAYLNKDEVDYVTNEGLHIEVPDNEFIFNVNYIVSINIINSFYDADFRARYHSKLAKIIFINKYGAGVKTIISGDENYFTFNELTFVRRDFEEPQFKPFDKVLVRSASSEWKPKLYSQTCILDDGTYNDGYMTIDEKRYRYCIPYEGNEHLVGTTDKPKEE